LVWKAPIAKFTRSTPAIVGGRIFLGDERGDLRAFDTASGRELWKHSLGGYVSACPVVTPAGIVFASEQGAVALLGENGSQKWKITLDGGVTGQPIATQSQLLVPTGKGLAVLRQADGQPDTRFEGPKFAEKILGVAKWRDQLFLDAGRIWTDFSVPPRTYVKTQGRLAIWVPESSKPSQDVQ
jgi:outer membrane protein assembly factor BamB